MERYSEYYESSRRTGTRRTNRKGKRARIRRAAAVAGLIRNLFLTAVIVLVIMGGFRVKALASETPACQTNRVYSSVQIQRGDTLWSIAEEHCGEDASNREIVRYVNEIRETNHIANDKELHEGAWLVVYRETKA